MGHPTVHPLVSGLSICRPLDADAVHIPVGQVYVIPERRKDCRFCIELCPQEALVEFTAMNAKGYRCLMYTGGEKRMGGESVC